MTADYPALPRLIGIVNGADVNTNGDTYDTPETQYQLLLDYSGIIAGWQRDFKIMDTNIHTTTAVQVLEGETAYRAAAEVEAGNTWNITYSVVKSGATVTVTFALRPGETLMEIADLFDEYGGAATCRHFGFEADGGISAASWTGNTVTLTLNNASAGWLRLAQQVQNVSSFADANGRTMSAHRSTLFGSHTWPSQLVAGETIRRPVPGFSGTFSGDTFVPFSAITGQAPELYQDATIYFDATDAPAGIITSLTTRGTMPVTMTVTGTGADVSMSGDGLVLGGGKYLRTTTGLPAGSIARVTIALDATITGDNRAGTAYLVGVDPTSSAETFTVRPGWKDNSTPSAGYLVGAYGPGNALSRGEIFKEAGQRFTVSCTVDYVAGTLEIVEEDGVSTLTTISGQSPLVMNDLRIGQATVTTIHRMAIFLEMAA